MLYLGKLSIRKGVTTHSTPGKSPLRDLYPRFQEDLSSIFRVYINNFQVYFIIIQVLSPIKHNAMMRILVPTDFSENSKLALNHAIKIVNQLGGTVSVLHVFDVLTVTASFGTIDQVAKTEREQELSELISEMKPLLADGARIEGLVKKGSSIDTICETANKMNVNLIVMGTKGADGMKKMFLGTTVSNVILETSKPVLAIPFEFKNFKISNITLALDNQKIVDVQVLKPVIDLVTKFNALLNLITVIEEENPNIETQTYLRDQLKENGIDSTYHQVSSHDVAKGILEFVDRENSDMLCLIHHSKGLFQEIFHSSVAEKIAFESQIPLLVLND